MRKLKLAAGLAMVAIATAACSSSAGSAAPPAGPSPSVQSTASGSLNWYTLLPPSSTQKIIQAFNAEYPNIKVQTVSFQGPDILTRIEAEFKSGVNKMDVMDTAGRDTLDPLVQAGVLASYVPTSLSQYPAALRAQMAAPQSWMFALNSHGLCYNPSVVSSPPTSYQDLLQPAYKGQIAYGAPIHTGFGQNFTVETRGVWGDAKWRQWWTQLSKQQVKVLATPSAAMDMVTRGEAGVVLYCNLSALTEAQQQGAPIKWVSVNPDIANDVDLALAAKAPDPKQARLFVNFMLSKGAQDIIASALGLKPIMPGAPIPQAAQTSQKITVVLSPSKYAVGQRDGMSMFNPNVYPTYTAFMNSLFPAH